jgi:DNA repair protein SbcD/Mre11
LKIVHTADIHLKSFDDERWSSLLELLELAEKESAGLFCVSGDLFDKDADADRLRPKIRALFSKREFKILIIPGNHDSNSYGGEFFGDDVYVFDSPDKPYTVGNMNIWGVPFTESGREGVLKALDFYRENLPAEKKNIILYHGELIDSFFKREDFGKEGWGRYMPVRLSDFKNIKADYILAGHFHTNFSVKKIDECYFVYPGSPVSVTRRETGIRKANVFEPGSPPSEAPLNSFYYDRKEIKFGPFDEENPLEKVEKVIEGSPRNSHLLIDLYGSFNGAKFGLNENMLIKELRKLESGRCSFENLEFKDMQRVADDELFRMFEEKLRGRDLASVEKERVWELALRAMVEAGL